MIKVTNRTNSPYDLQGVNGSVLLPAFGEVEGEFSDEYLELLESSGAVSVERKPASKPVKRTRKSSN